MVLLTPNDDSITRLDGAALAGAEMPTTPASAREAEATTARPLRIRLLDISLFLFYLVNTSRSGGSERELVFNLANQEGQPKDVAH